MYTVEKGFLKISQISQKIPVFESLFNKVADLQACNFSKKETPTQVFFREICEFFNNAYFEEHPWTTGPGIICFSGLLVILVMFPTWTHTNKK